jgi:LysM repeat protein/uncharacterized protein (DUF433 family)
MMENRKAIRNLATGLIISGSINIILVASIFYWMVKDTPPTPYCERKPARQEEQLAPLAMSHSNAELLANFKQLSMEQLLAKLSNTQLVESGYTQRDLALGALVSFHYFDLSRALLGMAQAEQKRSISYGVRPDGSSAEIDVYPGLSDQQFQAIISFAQKEKWPLTSKGLFVKVRKQKQDADPTLLEAFFLTPEFLAVEMLFNRAEVPVEKLELLGVLRQGNWPMLSKFYEQQRLTQDLSPARRQAFLLEYMEKDSKAAAYLMLKTDGAYAVRKLDDNHILLMLDLLPHKTQHAEQFSLALLTMPRSDAVWRRAANRLYEYHGEPIPEKFQHHAALARFLPGSVQNLTKPIDATQIPVPQPVSTPAAAPVTVATPKPKPAPVVHVHTSKLQTAQPQQKQQQQRKIYTTLPVKPPVPVRRERIHIVQDGENLWKISRRYNVDVDKIRSYNHLEGNKLKPGTTLRIPV